jgi:ATP-dependent helicase/nuclease subunit A
MNAPRIIPEAVLRLQITASDPKMSAWVAANAGSGKTHVLAQRVIRLLLEGVEPGKILCITFTKAAAANMANRVFDELRRWTALDDTKLDAAIRRMSGLDPDPARRARARRLFALALETPGGLKVQTIHAFCTRLLHQFPFEAGVAARFDVLDEASEAQLLGETTLAILLEATLTPDAPIGHALATAITFAADRTFKEVVGEAIRKRDVVRAWIDHGGSVDAAIALLCETLGISGDDTLERIESEMTEGPLFPSSRWSAAANILLQGSKSDQDQATRLANALATAGSERAGIYLGIFFTDKLEARQRVITKAMEKGNSELADCLQREAERLLALLERRKAVTCRKRTAALITIADAVISRYQKAKDRRGLLDYDDLIDKTLEMLDRISSGWLHYKLDRGVDHVLIDEAQDTSPRQWEIIAHIISEFTSGEGARDGIVRTIFAVGDEKQSIFSFQGAAPREFDSRRRELHKKFRDAGLIFDPVNFSYSFRSGAAILQSVDYVFRDPTIYRSIHAEEAYPLHHSLTDA